MPTKTIQFNDSALKSKDNQVKNYLLLTSSLLVDRVYLHTKLVSSLNESGQVTIWATSVKNEQYSSVWEQIKARIESFPAVRPFMEFPHNFLRRLNEYVWDFRYELPSRSSMMKHVRDKSQLTPIYKFRMPVRLLKTPARVLASLKTEQLVENQLEKILLRYPRSSEAEERIKREKPTVIVTTGPFQFEQPAIHSIARRLKIPNLAYIPSWDNVTTKNRMVYKYDGYIVWSEQTKKELHEFYPATKNYPVYVVGAPQFDIFFQTKYYQSREEFCQAENLDPKLPIIVYAIGSPNFLKEHHGAVHLAERVKNGELGNVQMLVRPHPIHDNAEMSEILKPFAPQVKLQQTANVGKNLTERSQDESQITEWVNTFRHADVVVNLSSTVTVDAAIFDKPVVNLDFDPQPGQADQELIKDVNHLWNHFKPIAESGGVWLVNDFDEMAHAINEYLKNPALHREKRKWIAQYVCGYLDGRCGERMAEAILDFAFRKTSEASR